MHVCSVLGTSETCAYDRTPHMPKPADCVKTVHGGGKKQSEENKLKVRNFKLKKENETIKDRIRDIRTLSEQEKKGYHKSIKVVNFRIRIILNMKVVVIEIKT